MQAVQNKRRTLFIRYLISEILNAFSPAPLKKEQMAEFYCADTMEYHTSDKYDSPIEDFADICRNPKEYSACLLLGHQKEIE